MYPVYSIFITDYLIAGQHDCGDKQHPNRSLSMEEAIVFLVVSSYNTIFPHILVIVICTARVSGKIHAIASSE